MILETLQKEMIAAMKNKDKERKDTLSSLIGAIKKAAIDQKCKENITEKLVDEVILKEKKTVQEMIDTCPAERTELLQSYKNKMSIIEEFALQLITDENQIKKMIYNIISTTDIHESGKSAVMKAVMPKLKGKVDMKVANKVLVDILKKSEEF